MDVVYKQVIFSILVISTTEEIDLVFDLDAIVASSWCEVALPVWENLPPLTDLHVHEVFIGKAGLYIVLANSLHCAGRHGNRDKRWLH